LHSSMLRSFLLAVVLVACAAATQNVNREIIKKCATLRKKLDDGRTPWENVQDQLGQNNFGDCYNWASYATEVCGDCERVKKVSDEYVNGFCCPSFECIPVEDEPCCGVTCLVDDQVSAQAECNIIHENNDIWNKLSPYYEAMIATLVEPQDQARGKCCNKYQCSTSAAKLCENEIERTPCPTEATCPVCYTMVVTEPVDVLNGKCCPAVECVRDDTCLCNNRENKLCPLPVCDEQYEYPVVVSEGTADACCPVWTCQRNMDQICAAKLAASVWTVIEPDLTTAQVTGYDPSIPQQVCGPCSYVSKVKQPNFAAGECFPKWKCAPVADKCCESDIMYGVGQFEKESVEVGNRPSVSCSKYDPECGECQDSFLIKPSNKVRGKCCDTFTCLTDSACVCEDFQCTFDTASEYKTFFCPDRPGENVKQFYEVVEIPASPETGKCCPHFSCRQTAAAMNKQARLEKKKLKKAAKKAAKASTTVTPKTSR